MKIKNKLLIFLGIFIILIIPKNVSAKEIYPFSIKINNVNFSNSYTSYNGRISQPIPAQSSFTLSIEVSSTENSNFNLYQGFDDYPYIFIFFKTYNTPEEIGVSKGSGCNTSCFSGDGIQLKQIGVDAESTHTIYVMVLKARKWVSDYGVGSGQGVFSIGDTITLTNKRAVGTNDRGFVFYSVLLSDNLNVLNNSNIDIDNMISNANSNRQAIINSQNANTQSIINNQNTNANTAHQDSQAINNTMKDETGVSNNDVSSKTTEWSNKLLGSGPVSQMVLMPITLLNGYVSGMNASCTPYNLGNLMGTDITLPCINVSNYLGATLWGVIDVLFSGFMIYAMGKKFVKIFNDFTNLRDNQMDELYGGGK